MTSEFNCDVGVCFIRYFSFFRGLKEHTVMMNLDEFHGRQSNMQKIQLCCLFCALIARIVYSVDFLFFFFFNNAGWSTKVQAFGVLSINL